MYENIIHEVTKYCSTTNVLPPKNYQLYGIQISPSVTKYIFLVLLIEQDTDN